MPVVINGIFCACATICLCCHSRFANVHCPCAGLEQTTIVDVCAEYLEAAAVGEAAVVAKWEKDLPPMASKVDVRVTNIPSYLRTRVKMHDAFIISEYKKAHPTDPDAGSIAKVFLPAIPVAKCLCMVQLMIFVLTYTSNIKNSFLHTCRTY
jgi:hypothetical protein